MARRLIAAVGMLVFLTNGSSEAGFYTGNTMLPYCHGNISHVYGYVAGVVDKAMADADFTGATYIRLFRELKDHEGFVTGVGKLQGQILNYCLPENVVLSQVGDVFCKYLRDKPEVRQNSADVLLHDSLKVAFPCKK
ncbi:hypothetical protein BjapCC829_23745 [Bradyrhizobium barranii]|uniref:Rap1a immunity protein domain-containing protein n=1 Tax=Bradyrhizobium barranii TaxID=2992140 RepID=A0ABY3QAX6_9BRAD|nr:Rap1a/Tai family immunity protein [Bradyrhizobium japonicum]UFW83002.1 hypothetical protein BjapCC829_23745 [Bradyrhizobium japonicum]